VNTWHEIFVSTISTSNIVRRKKWQFSCPNLKIHKKYASFPIHQASGIFASILMKTEKNSKFYLKFLYIIFHKNPCSLSRVDLWP
jgi:hypothetical protein